MTGAHPCRDPRSRFGGLELSCLLSAELANQVDVTVIDQDDSFTFGSSKLDVMSARRTMEEVRIPYRDITPPGVTIRQESILSVDPEGKRVVTNAGAHDADVLVVALGADLASRATPGLDALLQRGQVGRCWARVGPVSRSAVPALAAPVSAGPAGPCLLDDGLPSRGRGPARSAKFAGRGEGARLAGAVPGAQANAPAAAANVRAGQGVIACDVSGQVMRKVEALSAYRSQFPLEPGMFPQFLLQEIFGCEYF